MWSDTRSPLWIPPQENGENSNSLMRKSAATEPFSSALESKPDPIPEQQHLADERARSGFPFPTSSNSQYAQRQFFHNQQKQEVAQPAPQRGKSEWPSSANTVTNTASWEGDWSPLGGASPSPKTSASGDWSPTGGATIPSKTNCPVDFYRSPSSYSDNWGSSGGDSSTSSQSSYGMMQPTSMHSGPSPNYGYDNSNYFDNSGYNYQQNAGYNQPQFNQLPQYPQPQHPQAQHPQAQHPQHLQQQQPPQRINDGASTSSYNGGRPLPHYGHPPRYNDGTSTSSFNGSRPGHYPQQRVQPSYPPNNYQQPGYGQVQVKQELREESNDISQVFSQTINSLYDPEANSEPPLESEVTILEPPAPSVRGQTTAIQLLYNPAGYGSQRTNFGNNDNRLPNAPQQTGLQELGIANDHQNSYRGYETPVYENMQPFNKSQPSKSPMKRRKAPPTESNPEGDFVNLESSKKIRFSNFHNDDQWNPNSLTDFNSLKIKQEPVDSGYEKNNMNAPPPYSAKSEHPKPTTPKPAIVKTEKPTVPPRKKEQLTCFDKFEKKSTATNKKVSPLSMQTKVVGHHLTTAYFKRYKKRNAAYEKPKKEETSPAPTKEEENWIRTGEFNRPVEQDVFKVLHDLKQQISLEGNLYDMMQNNAVIDLEPSNMLHSMLFNCAKHHNLDFRDYKNGLVDIFREFRPIEVSTKNSERASAIHEKYQSERSSYYLDTKQPTKLKQNAKNSSIKRQPSSTGSAAGARKPEGGARRVACRRDRSTSSSTEENSGRALRILPSRAARRDRQPSNEVCVLSSGPSRREENCLLIDITSEGENEAGVAEVRKKSSKSHTARNRRNSESKLANSPTKHEKPKTDHSPKSKIVPDADREKNTENVISTSPSEIVKTRRSRPPARFSPDEDVIRKTNITPRLTTSPKKPKDPSPPKAVFVAPVVSNDRCGHSRQIPVPFQPVVSPCLDLVHPFSQKKNLASAISKGPVAPSRVKKSKPTIEGDEKPGRKKRRRRLNHWGPRKRLKKLDIKIKQEVISDDENMETKTSYTAIKCEAPPVRIKQEKLSDDESEVKIPFERTRRKTAVTKQEIISDDDKSDIEIIFQSSGLKPISAKDKRTTPDKSRATRKEQRQNKRKVATSKGESNPKSSGKQQNNSSHVEMKHSGNTKINSQRHKSPAAMNNELTSKNSEKEQVNISKVIKQNGACKPELMSDQKQSSLNARPQSSSKKHTTSGFQDSSRKRTGIVGNEVSCQNQLSPRSSSQRPGNKNSNNEPIVTTILPPVGQQNSDQKPSLNELHEEVNSGQKELQVLLIKVDQTEDKSSKVHSPPLPEKRKRSRERLEKLPRDILLSPPKLKCMKADIAMTVAESCPDNDCLKFTGRPLPILRHRSSEYSEDSENRLVIDLDQITPVEEQVVDFPQSDSESLLHKENHILPSKDDVQVMIEKDKQIQETTMLLDKSEANLPVPTIPIAECYEQPEVPREQESLLKAETTPLFVSNAKSSAPCATNNSVEADTNAIDTNKQLPKIDELPQDKILPLDNETISSTESILRKILLEPDEAAAKPTNAVTDSNEPTKLPADEDIRKRLLSEGFQFVQHLKNKMCVDDLINWRTNSSTYTDIPQIELDLRSIRAYDAQLQKQSQSIDEKRNALSVYYSVMKDVLRNNFRKLAIENSNGIPNCASSLSNVEELVKSASENFGVDMRIRIDEDTESLRSSVNAPSNDTSSAVAGPSTQTVGKSLNKNSNYTPAFLSSLHSHEKQNSSGHLIDRIISPIRPIPSVAACSSYFANLETPLNLKFSPDLNAQSDFHLTLCSGNSSSDSNSPNISPCTSPANSVNKNSTVSENLQPPPPTTGSSRRKKQEPKKRSESSPRSTATTEPACLPSKKQKSDWPVPKKTQPVEDVQN